VLRTRRDIACVLVNPLQALHPNVGAPGDSTLVDSGRSAHFDRAAYAPGCKKLREVCTERGIVLIFDEVFVGFRLAPGGAQEYFGVRADMVTYGKTVAGGLPSACSAAARADARFREDRPADICFARGTFNSHPYVMGDVRIPAAAETEPVIRRSIGTSTPSGTAARGAQRAAARAGLPVQVANLSSIWTICYTQPSRYNWMFQYYLRAAGLALSWVGTGRLIFSLNYTDEDFAEVAAASCRRPRPCTATVGGGRRRS
jgi:glutamate-1-semialdehyde 2,1-aminomutase